MSGSFNIDTAKLPEPDGKGGTFAVDDIKAACDLLATFHRDSGNRLTRFQGVHSNIVILVVNDKAITVDVHP